MLAYVGPDVMLPLASVLAAALGGVLFAWRWIVAFLARAWGWARGVKPEPETDDAAAVPATPSLVAPSAPAPAAPQLTTPAPASDPDR